MPAVQTVTLFFALLALAAFSAVAVALGLTVAGRFSTGVAGTRARLADDLRGVSLWLACGVAAVATLGSLYLSEVAGFPPCSLCWAQRGFMYPLALVLGAAAWRGWDWVRRPAAGWALAGAAVSLWHIAIERFPAFSGSGVCDPQVPCSLVWVEHFGFVTIPTMALAAFLLVAVLSLVRLPAPAIPEPTTERESV